MPSVQLAPADAPAWAALPHYRLATPSEADTTPVNRSADLSANCHLQYDKRTVTHLLVSLIVIAMLVPRCVCLYDLLYMYTLLFVELELRTGMGNLI